jgi:hypothetical protein
VSIDADRGIISIGSPNSPDYGLYKETPAIYPFEEQPLKFPVDSRLEHLMKSGNTLTETPGNLRLVDHLLDNLTNVLPPVLSAQYYERAGALYIFKMQRRNSKYEDGVDLSKAWSVSEQARLSPPDLMANALFGSSIKRTHSMVLATSESDNSAYIFNLNWLNVKFSSVEYVAVEGTETEVEISVVRDETNTKVIIGYSTSDLTATGVHRDKVEDCKKQRIEDRIGCGDYEQSSGTLTFSVGQKEASFNVTIVNDNCWERHLKYVQLSLHIPGAGAILGEHFRSQLRIDDDDWMGQICPDGIS